MGKFSKSITRLAAALSALSIFATGAARAQSITTVDQAVQYLQENPSGPLAQDAFRLLIMNNLANQYPEFSRAQIRRGVSTFTAPTVSGPAMSNALAQVTGSTY